MFLSAAHRAADIDEALEAASHGFKAVRELDNRAAAGSASADRFSSRTIEIAVRIPAQPDPGFGGARIETGADAFPRRSGPVSR